MIESYFKIPPLSNIIGLLLMCVGIIGIGYVSYMYAFWGEELPSFSAAAKHQYLTESSVQGGFGDLLHEMQDESDQYVPMEFDSSETTTEDTPVESYSNDKDLASLEINRSIGSTLGTQQFRDDALYLTVPKLNIHNAVVELQVDGADEYIYDTVLTKALAHLNGSALPGEFGNPFIFGHSKLPIFADNDYESMFTNLPKIRVGDVIDVTYQGKTYRYQISQTGVVEPNDVFVMHQPQSKKMLTLMTCIPPGFANQRYIAVSELIDVL